MLGIGCNPTIANWCCTCFIPAAQHKFSCGFSFAIMVSCDIRENDTGAETAITVHITWRDGIVNQQFCVSKWRIEMNLVRSLIYSHGSSFKMVLLFLPIRNRIVFMEATLGGSLQTIITSYISKSITHGRIPSGQIAPREFALENIVLELNGSYFSEVLLHRIQSIMTNITVSFAHKDFRKKNMGFKRH